MDKFPGQNQSNPTPRQPSLGELLKPFSTPLGLPLDRKITCIKLVRDVTSMGLKESKEFVELLMDVREENLQDTVRKLAVLFKETKVLLPSQIRTFLDKTAPGQTYKDYHLLDMVTRLFPNQLFSNEQVYSYIEEVRDRNRY